MSQFIEVKDQAACEMEGRKAFQKHGVTASNRHSYPIGSIQRQAFISGVERAKMDAQERALGESAAYQALSLRDNAVDRAWATKLSPA